ncbi:MAG: hypothetical protein JSV68_09360 [Anaerolineaceae bacterium]|nr:MAG: hypothetical protein JSV68_09360 [Anaerolineaceae bacterium]
MESITYGRRKLTFAEGTCLHTSTSVTERSLASEDEDAFIARLMSKYGNRKGTIEVVIKGGKPDYAIITLNV